MGEQTLSVRPSSSLTLLPDVPSIPLLHFMEGEMETQRSNPSLRAHGRSVVEPRPELWIPCSCSAVLSTLSYIFTCASC